MGSSFVGWRMFLVGKAVPTPDQVGGGHFPGDALGITSARVSFRSAVWTYLSLFQPARPAAIVHYSRVGWPSRDVCDARCEPLTRASVAGGAGELCRTGGRRVRMGVSRACASLAAGVLATLVAGCETDGRSLSAWLSAPEFTAPTPRVQEPG